MQMARSVIYVSRDEAPCGLERVRAHISGMPGISDCKANHLSGLLVIEYDQERVTLNEIRRGIRAACD